MLIANTFFILYIRLKGNNNIYLSISKLSKMDDFFDIKDFRSITPISEFASKKQKYIYDIDNILFANTGRLDALSSNQFFSEAGQMLINAIMLFEQGYFDCAFYSMRQSLELSITTLFITANDEGIKSWDKLESGFEKGRMLNFLRENEAVFKDVREKMDIFFQKIRGTTMAIDKYVHKQGFKTFYSARKSFDGQKKYHNKELLFDFEEYLKDCIGAVAIYRLAIDPLPVLLMDYNVYRKVRPMMAEPFSDEFIERYIGNVHIETYKTTEIYKDYYNYFNNLEMQNDAITNVIHNQFVDRTELEEILKQIHLLDVSERIAVAVISISDKITRVYTDSGCQWYFSNTKSQRKDQSILLGLNCYDEFFISGEDFNNPFKGIYISRCNIEKDTIYLEHNELFVEQEIVILQNFAVKMSASIEQANTEILDFVSTSEQD